MVNIEAAYVINAFGQLVFAGLEAMPEPPHRRSIVLRLRAGSCGAAAHVLSAIEQIGARRE